MSRTAGILAMALAALLGGNGCNGAGERNGPGHAAAAGLPGPAPPPAEAVITLGRPGDRWLDVLPCLRVGRATRDGRFGYEATYEVPGYGDVVLFWSRGQIDLTGEAPDDYRVRRRPLGAGRLHYPDRVTDNSLPAVYRAIGIIEREYADDADGAIAGAEMFAIVASLGAGFRAPGPAASSGAGAGAAGAVGTETASSYALGRAMEAAGRARPSGTAAHHIVAGNARFAREARGVLRTFDIGINHPANGVFLPATRATPNTANAAVHSTLHTKEYYRAVDKLLFEANTRQEVLNTLESIGQALLRGEFP